ncbi:MAG: zinc metallopeptidase [Christensenellales bacterium]
MFYWEYILMGVILIPGIIFASIAQAKISSAYNYYGKVKAKSGIIAKDAVRKVLDGASLENVKIGTIKGHLTDNYNPKNNVVSLSESVASSDSVAALGVALHEVGHAIQHNKGYFPAKLRKGVVVFSNAVSVLLWPLVFIGIMYNFVWLDGVIGSIFLWSGIGFFGIAVILNLVTLPVEYNASNRALAILEQTGILDSTEIPGCKKVLRAAGLTYVASLVMSILILLRFVLLAFAGRQK